MFQKARKRERSPLTLHWKENEAVLQFFVIVGGVAAAALTLLEDSFSH